jgi:hypothetical protein
VTNDEATHSPPEQRGNVQPQKQSWLRTVGRILTAISSAAYLYVAYFLCWLSARNIIATFGWALIGLASSFVLVWVRFTGPGRLTLARSQSIDWCGTITATVGLVALSSAGFTSLSVGLYQMGIGSIKGGPLQGSQIVDAAFNSYLWHLADAIPLLKITSTLNWTLRHPFTDHVQGGLILLYTLTVIIPVVYLATQIVKPLTASSRTKDGEL